MSSGGVENVLWGGIASGTTVEGGGYECVYSGGAIDGATLNGGELDRGSGSTAAGSTLTFAGGGEFKLDGTGPTI